MKSKLTIITALLIALGLLGANGVDAQLTVFNSNVPSGFSVLGYIQAATVNNPANPNSGGTLTINGITMIVPDNSVVQMPANTLKWAELFDLTVSSPVYDPTIPVQTTPMIPSGTSGLALSDNASQALGVSPELPFNATVIGNIDVKNNLGYGVGAYIVGLILPINQDLGNGGQGYITYIDYAKGRFEIGGTLNKPNTGTVIEINDPVGRHGWAHSPDPRWSVDTDNPTVTTGNGYPMGLPRWDPAVKIDPDRPIYNRPLNPAIGAAGHDPLLQPGAPLQAFTMAAKTAPNAAGVTTPDPWKQVPFMVGDFVSYSGTLCKLDPNTPYDPKKPWNRQTYYSVNTVSSDKLAVYTAPGSVILSGPSYVQIFRTVLGTGGASLTVPANTSLGIQGGTIPIIEPRLNIVIRGWATDATNFVDLYAVDVSATGVVTNRLIGTVFPEAGITGIAGRAGNRGRFRFDIGKGNFLPPTRTYRAVSRHGSVKLPNQDGITGGVPLTGLKAGEFTAPNFIYQFADAPPGYPNVPNNLNTFPFLTKGEGGNPSAGQLIPFPPFLP